MFQFTDCRGGPDTLKDVYHTEVHLVHNQKGKQSLGSYQFSKGLNLISANFIDWGPGRINNTDQTCIVVREIGVSRHHWDTIRGPLKAFKHHSTMEWRV